MAIDTARYPCPKCGSSDGVAKLPNADYCHACQATFPKGTIEGEPVSKTSTLQFKGGLSLQQIGELPCEAIPSRGIDQRMAEEFGVRTEYDTATREPKAWYFPYYKDGRVVAYKKRTPDKQFTAIGDIKGALLFGAQRVGEKGQLLIITEGELDAISATQMLRKLGKSYKVVSLVNGANVKSLRDNLEWIEKFDKIVLSFDMDEAGAKVTQDACALLSVGKVAIMNHGTHKDANDILLNEAPSFYFNALNTAKEYRPDGIVSISEAFSCLESYDSARSVPYPWEGLNRLTYGLREREITLVTAGSGVGKSALIRELEHHLITTTEDKVGILALEESTARTIYGIMSVEANQPLHLKEVRETVDMKEIQELFNKLFSDERVYSYDHFGSTDENSLLSRIRYLIKSLGVHWIILDHISIAVSGIATDDERKLIDRLMTKLRQITEETGVGMVVVSHLRRLSGDRGHEDGAQVSLSHLRGSQSLAQLSDTVIALERNQSDSNLDLVNRTTVRVLKNRYAGNTGVACELQYNPHTGRLSEVIGEY